MEIKPLLDQGPWRVLGTDGHTKISVAPPTSVKVVVGEGEDQVTCIVPLQVVVALQSAAAIEFIQHPDVAPFMWAANSRESRVKAAEALARREVGRLRREFVEAAKAFGVEEIEAWELARIKHP